MFGNDSRKNNLLALIGGLVVVVLTFLAMALNIVYDQALPSEFLRKTVYLIDVIIPVLLIGVLVFLLWNKGERTFDSKWWYPAAVIFYVSAVKNFSGFLTLIASLLSGEIVLILSVVSKLFLLAGFTLLTVALLDKKLDKLLTIGLAVVLFARVIGFINEEITGLSFVLTLVEIGLLIVISLGINKNYLRTIAVVFAVINMFTTHGTVLENAAFIILAYLMVPAGKIKFDFYFIPGLAFAVMALSALQGLEYIKCFAHVLIFLVVFAAPVLLSVCFFTKKFDKLAVIGYILMYAALIVTTFFNSGIAAFNNLEFVLTVSVICKAVSLVLFGLIIFNNECPKRNAYKIALIVLSVLTVCTGIKDNMTFAVTGFSLVDAFGTFDYTAAMNLLLPVALFLSALVLVPFKFTKYQGIGKHIFLTFITFGIWHLIWVYNVTKNLEITDRDTKCKYAKELLLYMFLPFYSVYWNYKAAYATDKYAVNNGVESNRGTLIFILSFVSSVVSSVLIQSKFNEVESK